MVYKAEVKSTGMTASYIGIAANSFKERYTNHKLSFNNLKYECNTSLSKHIWGLKKINEPFAISWSIVSKAKPYNPVAKTCNLCLMEKTCILLSEDANLLNKRSEVMNKCRHREKFLLSKCYKTWGEVNKRRNLWTAISRRFFFKKIFSKKIFLVKQFVSF